jgi:phosphate-selective porin OprO and OprP
MGRCRSGWWWAGAVVLAAMPGTLHARELQEILKDKGVINYDEMKESTKSSGGLISYKEGKGFVFQTGDGRFETDIGGRIQVRYTLLDVEDAFQNAPAGREDSQSIDITRARFWAQGRLYYPGLTYMVQVDFSGSGGDLIRDVFLDYLPIADIGIRAGQFKTQYVRQEITSSGKQQFVDRSLATNAMRLERMPGVLLYGTQLDQRLEYYGGIYNGDGRNKTNTDTNFAYIARIVGNPLGPMPYEESDVTFSEKPLAAIGGSFVYNRVRADSISTQARVDPADPTRTIAGDVVSQQAPILRTVQPFYRNVQNLGRAGVDFTQFGAEAAFRWMGFSAAAEYLYAELDTDRVVSAAPFSASPGHFNVKGWYAQAGYFIIPKKLEAAFRWSELDPNDDVDHNDQREIRGALSYYFNGHNFKIQGDVGELRTEGVRETGGDVSARNNMEYRLQVQYIF